MYRSHSHPALLSLIPSLIPPSKRSSSPPQESLSPTEKPKLRFLEFDSSSLSSSHTTLPSPPPPPPLLPVKSQSSPKEFAPPKLKFNRSRKSVSPPTLPLPIPEEEPKEPGADFGIKPRTKANLTFTPIAEQPITPDPSIAVVNSILPSTSLAANNVPYIPPPPPLPPPITHKYKQQAHYARRGNPTAPLSHKMAPSRPAKPSQPYSPATSQLSPNLTPQKPSRLPLVPTDSPGFSLPRTIRKSSEAFQLKVRSRLTKSGTSALMPAGSRNVRSTAIFGSYEPEQEESDAKPNLSTLVLTGCHELGPESLLSIGNMVGEQIRSIDLSLCPITDVTVGEFAKFVPNLRHLAIRYFPFLVLLYSYFSSVVSIII